MRRIRPYINSFKRRIYEPISLQAASVRTEVVAPETARTFAPLIALTDERTRITQTIANHNLDYHLRFFEVQDIRHAPVIRYEVSSALVLFNGVVTQSGNFNRVGPLDHRKLLTAPIVPLEKASYCLEDRSYFFFGHWLRSFAQCLLAEEGIPLIHFTPPSWSHATTYENLFGLPSVPAAQYHVDRLVMFQDFSQSDHKALRYKDLRNRLQSRVTPAPEASKQVYLKRGNTGAARVIANEAQLEAELATLGFNIIDLAVTPIDEILARCVGAELALTIEGSHADHLHWLIKPGGTLWVLNPDNHFNTSQFAVAQTIGNRTACSVITSIGKAVYEVDLDRLKKTYELILK